HHHEGGNQFDACYLGSLSVELNRMLQGIMKCMVLAAALLLFATTATASDRCMNYVSCVHQAPSCGDGGCDDGKCAFTSFNARTRTSLVVATMKSVPYIVTWDKDFRAVMYKALGVLTQKDFDTLGHKD